jgi:hypothetical protein
MSKEAYINRIIEINLSMGYPLESIMDDMKAAMQRDLQIQLKNWDKFAEIAGSIEGLVQLKRLTK